MSRSSRPLVTTATRAASGLLWWALVPAAMLVAAAFCVPVIATLVREPAPPAPRSVVAIEPMRVLPAAPWPDQLDRELKALLAGSPGEVTLFVKDLERDVAYGYGADVPSYLGSGIKMLYLMALYDEVNAGRVRLKDRVWYGWNDLIDGAPTMNRMARGTSHRLDDLKTYMLRDSDNAATNLVVKKLGLDVARAAITRTTGLPAHHVVDMMHVRRGVYRKLDPRADDMRPWQVRDLRWRNAHNTRLDLMKKHIGPPYGHYGKDELRAAYDAYYAEGWNRFSMREMGGVLEMLARGEIISPEMSERIIADLVGAYSSGHRIRGALPKGTVVAHKTGTQRRRICDLALVTLPDRTPLIIAVAVKDVPRPDDETLLRTVARLSYDLAWAWAEEVGRPDDALEMPLLLAQNGRGRIVK